MNFLHNIFSFFGIVLSTQELQKISLSWALKFVLHMCTVLGFTIILALFIGEFGVDHLPELFGVEALFAIIGTFAISGFLRKFEKKKALLIGALSLFFLSIAGFILRDVNIFLFFGILILGYSVIITQLNIIFSLFVEELFSPLESEKAFPLVESAEPVGGIFAGLITGFGIHYLHPEQFILAWGGLILLILPLIFLAKQKLERVPRPHSEADHVERTGVIEEIKVSWFHIFNNPFLKTLFVLVIIQWMVFNLIEFQYSSAAAHAFTGDHGSEDAGHGGGDAVVQELAHGLGLVHIGLYGLLLLFQLFLASRIQKRLGVVRTILLHPLMIFLSSIVMAAKFSFFSTLLAKGSFEIFGGPSRNAYHASFYVFRPHVRERAKEFLEGIARPLGMLIGTIFILIIQWVVHHFDLPHHFMTSAISFLILLFIGWRYFSALETGDKYTLLARKNLETRGPAPEKLDAIEILGQKGHKGASSSLLKVLKMRNEKPEVKIQILKTLGDLRDPNAIPEILKCFDHDDLQIQIAAVESLSGYKNLGDHFLSQSFAKHRVIEVLQELFVKTKSKKLKKNVIQVFQNIRHPDIIPFLLESLRSEDEETVLGAIRVCGMFKDISVAHYLEPFLHHENTRIKASAIIAMWQFVPYRLQLTVAISSMFESNDEETLQSAIYIIGEIKGIQEFQRLIKLLESTDNIHIKKHIYVALAKMEHSMAIREIVDILLDGDKELAISTRKLIFSQESPKHIKKSVRHYLEQKVAHKIHSLLREEGEEILERMQEDTLQKLHDAYEIIGEKKEMLKISDILEKKRKEKERAKEKAEKEHQKEIEQKENPEKNKNSNGFGELSLDDLM
jgi:HEAT repeat protein